jgi:hypothetical protein
MLAVGEYLLGYVDDWILRMMSGLANGGGCSRQEPCGALIVGVLLIGALHGRTKPTEDDRECQRLAAEYRERFAQELGATRCCDLRVSGHGSGGTQPCSAVVERAARILLQVLDVEETTCIPGK